MAELNKPEWAIRLVEERDLRSWTQAELAEELQRLAPGEVAVDVESVVRSIKGWESGEHRPGPKNRKLLARLYGTTAATLFGPDNPVDESEPVTPGDALELARRMQRSDLDEATIETLVATVDQLASRYSADPPEELWRDASEWLDKVGHYLERSKLSNSQQRQILTQAGWLALLVGCLEFDMGRSEQAERSRQAAYHFGIEADQPRIVAWAHEMTAWFAETTGDDDTVIRATRAGQEVAPGTDVAVQLAGKEAEVLARRGDHDGARQVLERARTWMDALPYPDSPGNHFNVDPSKFDKVIMRVSRLLGDYDLADLHAEQMIRSGRKPDGSHAMPMRVADAKASMAVSAMERGDIARAVELGHEALDVPRKSLPSLHLVTSELVIPLSERYPEADGVPGLIKRFEKIREAISSTS
ncbi:MAG: helix-turn-helix transcriptional regulator [Acidimicrobiales bacterium]